MTTETEAGAERRRACAWTGVAFALAGASCGHAQSANRGEAGASTAIEVLEVAPAEYGGAAGDPLEAACRAWRLSTTQVVSFFRLSQRYDQAPYGAFYQVPCAVSGRLASEGETWDFVIGGGGTATWTRAGQVRHFGCSAQACAPLVLLPADSMDPP